MNPVSPARFGSVSIYLPSQVQVGMPSYTEMVITRDGQGHLHFPNQNRGYHSIPDIARLTDPAQSWDQSYDVVKQIFDVIKGLLDPSNPKLTVGPFLATFDPKLPEVLLKSMTERDWGQRDSFLETTPGDPNHDDSISVNLDTSEY